MAPADRRCEDDDLRLGQSLCFAWKKWKMAFSVAGFSTRLEARARCISSFGCEARLVEGLWEFWVRVLPFPCDFRHFIAEFEWFLDSGLRISPTVLGYYVKTPEELVIMSPLIDGLPDEIAIQCLARVPFYFHPQLQLVCHSWRTVLRSPRIIKTRCEVGASEELLCALAYDPENIWQLYDPLLDRWITLPVMPSEIRHLARFGAASVGGKLFVIGGGSDRVDPLTGDHDRIFASNEVWSYDPLRFEWAQRSPMLVPRAMFACCALDGKIVVAGGFTNCRETITKAEIYDPQLDKWEPLPDLRHSHTSACSGVIIGGKMHVLHKGLSTIQILDYGGKKWDVADYGWLQGPMAVVRGELYVLSNGCISKQYGDNLTDRVVSYASDFQSRISFGMIGVGDEIFIIGGVIGPGPRNQFIKQLSDADALNVRVEKPAWRRVSPMTHCCGSILGSAVLRI
ncbi:hypothetical protein ZIOFF_031184 [Zingiber officinale]|uniref:F-box domain-containing protein n=2 Tax=Zingiber officinale TaxID=94328 RepID=A0A8J5GH72_ZINOF|nr:hypothetical protein ZIOFF_031184 [Zingiber officinale]